MIKCPNCGNECGDGANFCGECGTKLLKAMVCKSCGAEILAGSKFCQNCGASVSANAEAAEQESENDTSENFVSVSCNFSELKDLISNANKNTLFVVSGSGTNDELNEIGQVLRNNKDGVRIGLDLSKVTGITKFNDYNKEGSSYSDTTKGIFMDCTSLVSVVIPDGVTHLGMKCFANCTSLLNIEIPDSMKIIGHGCFFNCTSLVSIEFPDSTETFSMDCFANCTSLMRIKIPDSFESFLCMDGAFTNCTSLHEIDCALLEIVDDFVIVDVYSDGKHERELVSFLGRSSVVQIPDDVETIRSNAFKGCTSLKQIKASGSSLKSIEDNAFEGCTSLISADLSGCTTLINISSEAFKNCKSLRHVEFPDKISIIGENAFSGCPSLDAVYLPERCYLNKAFAFHTDIYRR